MKSGMNKTVKDINTNGTKLDVIAMIMCTQKSTVSKLQNKKLGDLKIQKLKQFVEATGGEMDILITLSNGEVIAL